MMNASDANACSRSTREEEEEEEKKKEREDDEGPVVGGVHALCCW